MAQHTIGTIDPVTTSGTALATLLTNFELARLSTNSGASRPSYAVADTIWLENVSANVKRFNIYDGTDDNALFELNTATGTYTMFADRWAGKNDAVDAKTANYTVVAADDGKLINVDATGGNRTVTLITPATAGNGFILFVRKSDNSANTVTLTGGTINGSANFVLEAQHEMVMVWCDAAAYHAFAFPATAALTDKSQRWTANQGFTPQSDTSSSGAVTFDFAAGNITAITLTENVTSITLSGAVAGDQLDIFITQDSTARTVSGWPVAVKWANGGDTPTISTTSGAVDIVTLKYNGTDYFGSIVQDYR